MTRLFLLACLLSAGLAGCGSPATPSPAPVSPSQAPSAGETASALPPTPVILPTSSVPLESIAGTYVVTLTEDQLTAAGAAFMLAVASKGTWQLELTNDGIARLSQETDIGMRPRAEGPYSLSADQLILGADTGSYACTKFGVEQGTYQWKLEGDQLNLTAIADECEDRSVLFIVGSWTKQP